MCPTDVKEMPAQTCRPGKRLYTFVLAGSNSSTVSLVERYFIKLKEKFTFSQDLELI